MVFLYLKHRTLGNFDFCVFAVARDTIAQSADLSHLKHRILSNFEILVCAGEADVVVNCAELSSQLQNLCAVETLDGFY